MKPGQLIHKNIRISGRVQGVGFRYSARNAASTTGIHGYIKNLPNGEVYIEAEGTSQQMEYFLSWCKEGPSRAKVSYLDITDGMLSGFTEFTIR